MHCDMNKKGFKIRRKKTVLNIPKKHSLKPKKNTPLQPGNSDRPWGTLPVTQEILPRMSLKLFVWPTSSKLYSLYIVFIFIIIVLETSQFRL